MLPLRHLAILGLASALVVGPARVESDEGLPARAFPHQRHALTHEGNAARGRVLFEARETTRCLGCHKVDGQGGEVGPDLSAIGGKFGRPHLIESLLEPSRQVLEGFRTSIVATEDGRVTTGIVRRDDGASLTIVDAEGAERAIPKAEIVERAEGDVSLMPEGLADALSPDQFADLIAYLETLRPGGEAAPGSNVGGAVRLPDGFVIEPLAGGLTGGTALDVLPDGRVLVCEQTGSLRVVDRGRLLDRPALTLDVDPTWERGLIGVTVDPRFPDPPFVYVCYVAKSPHPHHRISRFTLSGNQADPASERALLEGDDQRLLGGKVPAGHQGGALHFGVDGMLYAAIGEQTAGAPSQRLDTFQGKVLRIGPDGTIPSDNPFAAEAEGKYRAIWARGLRNPFTFAIRRPDGLLCINDVGDRHEEINLGIPGGNYGWPIGDGPLDDPRFVAPIHSYPRASICGGDFAPASWPPELRGLYLFADFLQGWIKAIDPERPDEVSTFATGLRNPVDLRFAPDGSLLVLLRNAWVIDGKFRPRTGSLVRIRRE